MGIGKVGGQVGKERRLVVFDGENGFAAQCIDAQHKILLGMQSVCSQDPSSNWQAGQERLGDRDLIGFLRNQDLQQGFLTLMGAKGEQMGSRPICRAGPTNRLAI